MGFLKTAWADKVTAVSAVQLNRIEQGIADAFGTTQSPNAAQAISFQSLDGENDYGYDFTFLGRLVGNPTIDHGLLMRFNNDATVANYSASDMWRWYQDPLGTLASGEVTSFANQSGLLVGQCNWSAIGSLIIRARILAASGQKRVVAADYTFARGDNDGRHMRGLVYGHWADTATAINRLDFALVQNTTNYPAPNAGVGLTGRAILRRLTV